MIRNSIRNMFGESGSLKRPKGFFLVDERYYNERDEKPVEGVIRAARSGDLRAVKKAVKAGINITEVGRFGESVLSAAVYAGRLEIVKFLLETTNLPAESLLWSSDHTLWKVATSNLGGSEEGEPFETLQKEQQEILKYVAEFFLKRGYHPATGERLNVAIAASGSYAKPAATESKAGA